MQASPGHAISHANVPVYSCASIHVYTHHDVDNTFCRRMVAMLLISLPGLNFRFCI